MTKKPTSAEIEAARKAMQTPYECNGITEMSVFTLSFYEARIIKQALAWCAEQEQKGE